MLNHIQISSRLHWNDVYEICAAGMTLILIKAQPTASKSHHCSTLLSPFYRHTMQLNKHSHYSFWQKQNQLQHKYCASIGPHHDCAGNKFPKRLIDNINYYPKTKWNKLNSTSPFQKHQCINTHQIKELELKQRQRKKESEPWRTSWQIPTPSRQPPQRRR